jgi:putative flippase GtrA
MQSMRFLFIGACNTLFGIAATFVLTRLFLAIDPLDAKSMGTAAMAVSCVTNVSFSFLTYKWFVFRTQGNYGSEFLRSLTIYGPTMAINTLLVAPLAAVVQQWAGQHAAVYIAQGVILAFTIVFSFFGHRRVTFQQKGRPGAGAAS